MSTRLGRRFVAVATAAFVVIAAFLMFADEVSATHVDPVELEGNPNCEAVPGTTEILKLESSTLVSGTHAASGGGTITVSNLGPNSFDWSSSGVVISAVFVKAGNGGNLYNYLPSGETSDTGLATPDKQAISHITFCSGGRTTTTSTEPTTTSTEPTTTSTEPTTTSTEPTTTTTEPTTTTTEQETTTTTEQETTTTTEQETTTTERSTTTTDDDDNGTTTTTSETTIPFDEVLPTEVTTTTAPEVAPSTLPFTGAFSDNLALIALVAIGAGLLTLNLTRMLGKEE